MEGRSDRLSERKDTIQQDVRKQRKYRCLRCLAAFEKYKNARNYYSKIRREEQKTYERITVDTEKENPKPFHKFIIRLSAKDQIIRLKDSKGRAKDTEEEIN